MFWHEFTTVLCFSGRKALRGWTLDTHAQYYYERKKMNAALHYMQRAMDQIDRMKSAEGKVCSAMFASST